MDVREYYLVAALDNRLMAVWDLRKTSTPLKKMDIKESLNVQCVGIFPNMKVFKLFVQTDGCNEILVATTKPVTFQY